MQDQGFCQPTLHPYAARCPFCTRKLIRSASSIQYLYDQGALHAGQDTAISKLTAFPHMSDSKHRLAGQLSQQHMSQLPDLAGENSKSLIRPSSAKLILDRLAGGSLIQILQPFIMVSTRLACTAGSKYSKENAHRNLPAALAGENSKSLTKRFACGCFGRPGCRRCWLC